MCNLYNMVTNHQAMIELGFLWERSNRGNLPPLCAQPDVGEFGPPEILVIYGEVPEMV